MTSISLRPLTAIKCPFPKEVYVYRILFLAALCGFAVSAQTKKILVMGGEDMVQELQSAAPQAHIVPVTHANIMQEIADADGLIGDIRPEEVRAAKKLKWVQVMSAGVGETCFFPAATICATATSSSPTTRSSRVPRSPTMPWPCFSR